MLRLEHTQKFTKDDDRLGLVSFSTVAGMFFWQIMSTLVIVIPIILLTKISGIDMGGFIFRENYHIGIIGFYISTEVKSC